MKRWIAKVEFWCNERNKMVVESVGPFHAEDSQEAKQRGHDIAYDHYQQGEEFITLSVKEEP